MDLYQRLCENLKSHICKLTCLPIMLYVNTSMWRMGREKYCIFFALVY
jgi:hypothetical protein